MKREFSIYWYLSFIKSDIHPNVFNLLCTFLQNAFGFVISVKKDDKQLSNDIIVNIKADSGDKARKLNQELATSVISWLKEWYICDEKLNQKSITLKYKLLK